MNHRSRDEDEVRGHHEDENFIALSASAHQKDTKRIKTDTSDSSPCMRFVFSSRSRIATTTFILIELGVLNDRIADGDGLGAHILGP